MYSQQSNPTKLLLVDDEPDIIEFLSYNFRKEGYEVYTAYDGQQAVQVIREHRPDMVITDILMPTMNGIVMCQQVKSMKENKNLPVIFLSASNDDLFALAAMKAGGSRYVSKPVRFTSLNQMVQELLHDPMNDVFKRRFRPE